MWKVVTVLKPYVKLASSLQNVSHKDIQFFLGELLGRVTAVPEVTSVQRFKIFLPEQSGCSKGKPLAALPPPPPPETTRVKSLLGKWMSVHILSWEKPQHSAPQSQSALLLPSPLLWETVAILRLYCSSQAGNRICLLHNPQVVQKGDTGWS